MTTKEGCIFCGLDEDSELLYGKLIHKGTITVHYFCMLFSSALTQRGRSANEGVLGFLAKDIRREQERGRRLSCFHCKKRGATIGCSIRKCKKLFHYPCGIKHNTMHQFFGSYTSFCPEHALRQEIQTSDRLAFHGTAHSICPICLNSVETRSSHQTLRTPCCKRSWIHRSCLQEHAIHFGYFFRCPLCNNKEEFQMEMLTYGIYIPEQDASWELEENAFQDLLHRHDRCDHPKCRCPDGAGYNKDGSRWEIILCDLCGSQGCHIACGNLSFYKPYFECQLCQSMLKKAKSDNSTSKKRRRSRMETKDGRNVVRRLGRSPTAPGYLKEVSDKLVRRILSCQRKVQMLSHEELTLIDSKVRDDEAAAPPSSSLGSAEFCPIKRPWPNEDEYVEIEGDCESDESDSTCEISVVNEGFEVRNSQSPILRLSPSDYPSPLASDSDVYD